MDKQHILDEIRRTAELNGGQPLGRLRFSNETGIADSDWAGVHWVRWNDAVQEAGYAPNTMTVAYTDDEIVEKLVEFIRELGHYPVANELRIRAKNQRDFPAESTFLRVGKKAELALKTIFFCRDRGGLDEVIEICQPIVDKAKSTNETTTATGADGYVYLMKSGKHYKIGRTNKIDKRRYEVGIQLPEELIPIHSIRTDDPPGIEDYWHKRFADKRIKHSGSKKKTEWFDLSPKDVAIFKRRKFM